MLRCKYVADVVEDRFGARLVQICFGLRPFLSVAVALWLIYCSTGSLLTVASVSLRSDYVHKHVPQAVGRSFI